MILLSGASGLVGTHLLRELLKREVAVRALYYSSKPTLEHPLLEWMQAGLLDFPSLEQAFEGVEYVYHCAAMVSYDIRDKAEMMDVNILGTANMVDLCLDKNIKKLIYVSSISSITNDLESELIDERSAWDDQLESSNYALSKHKAEMEVWRGIAEGLQAAIVNPGIILGEGDRDKSSNNLFRIVSEEFPYFTGGATAWVDVEDVVRAMLVLMDSTVSGERFILSAGNYAYRYIFTLMARAMGKRAPHIRATSFMSGIVWRMYQLRSLLGGKKATITRETSAAAQRIISYNGCRFPDTFPDFSYRSVEESIARIAPYYA